MGRDPTWCILPPVSPAVQPHHVRIVLIPAAINNLDLAAPMAATMDHHAADESSSPA